MPSKRKRVTRTPPPIVDPIFAFSWSRDGSGLNNYFGDAPVYSTLAEARAAWEIHRPALWRECPRQRIPDAAEFFDQLSCTAPAVLRAVWGLISFDAAALATVSEAAAADRATIRRFRIANPRGAQQIAAFLQVLDGDLTTVETWARGYVGTDHVHRPYPVFECATYGGEGAGVVALADGSEAADDE
jgi:hypothetical protein